MFHIYVACVLSGCCVWLQWFLSVFRCVFSSILERCFKCFICLQTHVATVVFDVSKADQVFHLCSSPSAASSRYVLLLALVGHLYDAAAESFRIGGTTRPSPLLSLRQHGPRVEHENECSAQACVWASGIVVKSSLFRDWVAFSLFLLHAC